MKKIKKYSFEEARSLPTPTPFYFFTFWNNLSSNGISVKSLQSLPLKK